MIFSVYTVQNSPLNSLYKPVPYSGPSAQCGTPRIGPKSSSNAFLGRAMKAKEGCHTHKDIGVELQDMRLIPKIWG